MTESNLRRPNGDGFYFRYFTLAASETTGLRRGAENRPVVEVRLDYGGSRVVGRACCSPLDEWSPEVGRKIALSRALAQIPRPARRPFWSLYFARSYRYERQLRRCIRPDVLSMLSIVAGLRRLGQGIRVNGIADVDAVQ